MSQLAELLQQIDTLRAEIESLRPIDREQEARVLQKFWLDWNYHSNAIEGNTLTYGETRAFLLHGLTAQGKPFRDYLDMKGHKDAIEYLEELVRQQAPLSEVAIREMHRILLVEPYEMPAITADGFPSKRKIAVGQYKTAPNSVRTSTGRMHFYASPEETASLMGDLIQWYREQMEKKLAHPLMLATLFHFRFVNIHPFDDGNGRMARLLMNLILMQHGFVPVIVPTETKPAYIAALEEADEGSIEQFAEYIAHRLIYSLELFLRAAKGERIDELADLDKQLALLQKKILSEGKPEYSAKTTASHEALFRNFLKLFLTGLLNRLAQLELLFGDINLRIACGTSNTPYKSIQGREDEIVQKLGKILMDEATIPSIEIDFWGSNLLNSDKDSVRLSIRFAFQESQVVGSYKIDSAIDSIKKLTENLLLASYYKEYDMDEINHLLYVVLNPLVKSIKKRADPAQT